MSKKVLMITAQYTCPHCASQNEICAYETDDIVLFCGECGRAVRVIRANGETKAEKP